MIRLVRRKVTKSLHIKGQENDAGEGKEKTPSLHRIGGGVQQEFEHSFSGTEIPWSFRGLDKKFSGPLSGVKFRQSLLFRKKRGRKKPPLRGNSVEFRCKYVQFMQKINLQQIIII
jgi:hypothetical protein